MRAMELGAQAPVSTHPLAPTERDSVEPGAEALRVRVTATAVCRTDLQLAEGDLPAEAVADVFPAYDDDGGLLLVLTPQ